METIYICEDNQQQLACLERIAQDYISFHCENNPPKIASFTNPYKLLAHIQEKNKWAVYLLDISLNSQIDGIQLAEQIRKLDPLGFIIFITSHDECMPLTFRHRIGALDYISKNSDDYRVKIMDALMIAFDRFHASIINDISNQSASLCLQSGATIHYIFYRDILYAKTIKEQHRIRIQTCSGCIEYYSSLKELQKQLPANQFFQCHRSVIVNINAIASIQTTENRAILKNNMIIPISKYKKETLVQLLAHNTTL